MMSCKKAIAEEETSVPVDHGNKKVLFFKGLSRVSSVFFQFFKCFFFKP